MKSPPPEIKCKGISFQILSQFQIFFSVFGVYFSSNISISQVRFNIRETKHDTQVLKSLNY